MQIIRNGSNYMNHPHTCFTRGKMISVDNFFRIFELIIFGFVVAICDLVHSVKAIYGLP